MKVYKIIYSDMEKGIVHRYERNKRDTQLFIDAEVEGYAMREFLDQYRIEIPTTDKSAFIAWLNVNATKGAQ